MCKRPAFVRDGIVFIPLTQGKFALVDVIDRELGDVTWTAYRDRYGHFYAFRAVNKTRVLLHRIVAKRASIIGGAEEVDHKDGNGLNCRRHNLRPATDTQNAQNRCTPRTNTSGVKGVIWNKRLGKWNAQISANGRRHWLGTFVALIDAASAYRHAAVRLHGEFATER
jgi:hypothetical protein